MHARALLLTCCVPFYGGSLPTAHRCELRALSKPAAFGVLQRNRQVLAARHDAHRSRQNAAASGHCAGVSIVHIPWRCPRAQPTSLALVNPHTPCCECPDAACSHLEAVSAISPGAGSTGARIVVMSSNLTLPVTSVVMCNQRHQPALFEGNQRAFGVRQRTSTAL